VSDFDAKVNKPLDIFKIIDHVAHPSALALYAGGLRASDPFIRFEMFYRVMEYFFPNLEKDQKTRNNLIRHLRNSPNFNGKTESEIRGQVKSWVTLRNRSTHPYPKKVPTLPRDDLRALRGMREQEPGMQRVAGWLLDNPSP
jgi:hypothetical protein